MSRSGRRGFSIWVALVLVSALYLFGRSAPTSTAARRIAAPPPVTAHAVADGGAPAAAISQRRTTTTLGSGGTLNTALERLGVEDASLRHALIEALVTELDPTRLSPDTGVVVTRDAADGLVSVALRDAVGSFVRARRRAGDDGPAAERVALPVRVAVETAGGRVTRSVGQALSHRAYGQELTLAYADIFQWDVDLLVDPRPGDGVRVVYEARYLGQVSDDLPAFGDAATRPGELLGLGRILAASYDGERASSAAFLLAADDGVGDYYDADGHPLRKTFLRSPLNYRRISSGFTRARRHPITGKVRPHKGVDYAAPSGTPVAAAADGRVVSVGWEGALGRSVRVRHGSEFVTVYGHLRSYARGLRKGATVRQNQILGYVGSSGRATGPHLHYTLIHRGRPIDPLRFRSPAGAPLPDEMRPRLADAKRTWSPLLGAVPMAHAAATGPTAAIAGSAHRSER